MVSNWYRAEFFVKDDALAQSVAEAGVLDDCAHGLGISDWNLDLRVHYGQHIVFFNLWLFLLYIWWLITILVSENRGWWLRLLAHVTIMFWLEYFMLFGCDTSASRIIWNPRFGIQFVFNTFFLLRVRCCFHKPWKCLLSWVYLICVIGTIHYIRLTGFDIVVSWYRFGFVPLFWKFVFWALWSDLE